MSEPWEDFASGATTATAPSSDAPPWEDFQKIPVRGGAYDEAQLKDSSLRGVLGPGTTEDAANVLRVVGALPGVLGQGVENAASEVLNYPAELWRADTGTPRQFVVKQDENGKAQLTMEDKPLPFQPNVPKFHGELFANADIDPVNSLLNKLATGMTTPGMLATLPLAEANLVKGYFLTQTVPGIVEGAAGAMDQSKDTKERVESGLSGAVNGLFSYLLGLKGAKAPAENAPGTLDAAKSETTPSPTAETSSAKPWDDFKQAEAPTVSEAPTTKPVEESAAAPPAPEHFTTQEQKILPNDPRPSLNAQYFHDAGDSTSDPDWWVSFYGQNINPKFSNQETAYQTGLYLRQLGDEEAKPVIQALTEARQKMSDMGKMVEQKIKDNPNDLATLFDSPEMQLSGMAQLPREAIEAAHNDGSSAGQLSPEVAKPLTRSKSSPPPEAIPTVPTETVPQAGLATPNLTPTAAGESEPTQIVHEDPAGLYGSRYIWAVVDGHPWKIRIADHDAGQSSAPSMPEVSKARKAQLSDAATIPNENAFNVSWITDDPKSVTFDDVVRHIRENVGDEFYTHEDAKYGGTLWLEGDAKSPSVEVEGDFTKQDSPKSEIPLGVNRPDVENPALTKMSDSDFDQEYRTAKKHVYDTEKLLDDQGGELTPPQRQTVADAQDRWGAARLERERRNYTGIHTEDVFRKMIDLADSGHDFPLFKTLANVLRGRGGIKASDVTGVYRLLPESLRANADFKEALGGKLEKFKAWLERAASELTPEAKGAKRESQNLLTQQQPAENSLVENPGLPAQEAAGGVETNSNPVGEPETYGIAQRVREARAEAGQSVPVPAGQGIASEASVGRGRQLLSQGANPEKALADFEATKRFSSDDIALIRARGEQLRQMSIEAEQKHGTDSNEFKIAWDLLADWDTRSKAMQTEWHKSGQAQQGETDIDTGTFTGLQRAFRDATGKDFTPEQEKTAKKHAEKNKTAEIETEQAKQKLFSTLDEETKSKESPKKEEPVEPHVRLIADKLKAYFESRASSALDRIKKRRSEGRLFTGIDPTELADYADYGASKILQKGLEVEKMSEEWAREMATELGEIIKPHLETIWKASQKMFYEGFKKNIGIGEQSSKVKKTIKSDSKNVEVNASKKALEAAQKAVREAAVKAADAEVKARTASAKSAKNTAEVQREATKKALEAATKRSREAATKLAESERARNLKQAAIDSFGEPGSLDEVRKMIAYRKPGEDFAPNQVRAIWNYAKRTYIEKGVTNFDDVRAKLATDLGISITDVTKALAQPKGAKRLTDELWKKQQAARRVQQQAKEFIRTTEMPGYVKALASIPKILFGLKVGFHGTVALGTHAPFVAFQPNFWKVYFQDFVKMYKMVGSPAFYEREAQDLFRRPNFTLATRAGLVNDPFKVEDFNNPALSQYLGALTGMGNRGYFVLKILRQDMFDQMWNQLPETAQVPEVATAISDGINHATGVIKAGAPTGSNLALFAPRLEGSRVAWLAVDPTKALMSAVNWKNATPAEKIFAINQIKEKAWVAGTLFGLLAFNAGILSATGSKQQINFNNPMRSDFLKFKGAGMDFSYGNAMLSMARLPVRLFQIRESNGGKLKNLIYPDEDTYSVLGEYARSQLSPFASLASTLWFKSDWQNRPLPNSERPVPKRLAQQGVKPYTWKEFWLEQILPIPFEEATREVWQHGLGMNPDQVSAMRRMVATVAVMSATGGRLTEDTNIKK